MVASEVHHGHTGVTISVQRLVGSVKPPTCRTRITSTEGPTGHQRSVLFRAAAEAAARLASPLIAASQFKWHSFQRRI